jgi:thiamine monophosphate kinase
LADAKIKPVIEIMKPQNLKNYAALCGWALARAHARSGDAAVLTGYLGSSSAFEEAIVAFSKTYADQNERDHAALVAAVRSGKVEARIVE